ncbi:hypothetical protein B1H18_12930 [Streptomyces tsukubensis]|uniref:Uncharacterized protein n=1 Tax=Streptomyces tsukubensis TaxID=83656 RepID=A0A1V4AAT4_9ACTN|nr:hypothetical protein B1H18_12930 [Streptomyces tsukubensis]
MTPPALRIASMPASRRREASLAYLWDIGLRLGPTPPTVIGVWAVSTGAPPRPVALPLIGATVAVRERSTVRYRRVSVR